MKATRGYGLLEGFLANKRAQLANSFISDHLRQGRILDIGCGAFPYFLNYVSFTEKYGIDKTVSNDTIEILKTKNIKVINSDIEKDGKIPFQDNHFDVVTMLAVIEHLEPENLDIIIKEIRRILKEKGLLIITTPAAWTDRLLRIMALFRLVSPQEIKEHKKAYTHNDINSILTSNGFKKSGIRDGYFEFFMNIWVVAQNI